MSEEFQVYFNTHRDSWFHLFIRLADTDAEFLEAARESGYDLHRNEDVPETRGVTFNSMNYTTGNKRSVVVLNTSRLDYETLSHELRHALFFGSSDVDWDFKLHARSGEEEKWNQRFDVVMSLALHHITKRLPESFRWVWKLDSP